MTEPLSDVELIEIEQRVSDALSVAPPPWPWLETRYATGGESFVQFRGDPAVDNEMYFSAHLGPDHLASPDPRLDLIIDFVGNAADDMLRLLAEVRRLRGLSG